MKTLVPVAATALALQLLAATSAFALEASADSKPAIGRSLFDYMVTKTTGDTATYDVPFPFEKLMAELAKKSQGTVGGAANLPAMLLIPSGRSLQKDHTDISSPRVIAAFTEHPLKANDVGLTVRDRIYVGYAAKANQIEVISYNEQAGRYEFQIVADYREGGMKRVMYANRAFCVECHKAQTPIFAKNTWDETNANMGVASAMEKQSATEATETFFGVVRTRGNKGLSYAIDTSTDRGGRLPAVSRYWQNGCKLSIGGLKPEDCRAAIFLYGLAAAQGLDPDAVPGIAAYADVLKTFKASLTEQQLRFYVGDIANRNPSGFEQMQILQMPEESDRVALWQKNLVNNRDIEESQDPKQTPLEAYAWSPGVDSAKQALDLTISTISGFVTPSERGALPKDAAKLAAAVKAAIAAGGEDKPFGELPLRKGALMGPFFKAAGVTQIAGTAITNGYHDNKSKMPNIEVDTGGAATGSGLFALENYCGTSCHGVQGFGDGIDFLARDANTTDKELWIKMIKKEKAEVCRRLDWTDPTVNSMARMPRPPRMQDFLKDEKEKGVSDRKILMETYRDKLLEFAGSPEQAAAVGISPDELTALAAKCKWTKYVEAN